MKDRVLEQVTKGHRVYRTIMLIIGAFIFAVFYNAYVAPNHLVYGGVGGFAIVINKLTGIPNIIIIDVMTVLLCVISVFTAGFKKTSYTLIGFGVYTLFCNLTLPLAPYFQINFDSFTFAVLFYALVGGIGTGLIYRAGFNTGGVDSIVVIIQHYFHIPQNVISVFVNSIIIFMGVVNFGIVKSIYAIILLKVMNIVNNGVLIGMSNSKICYIKSRRIEKIEKLLSEDLNIGYSIMDTGNGIGKLKKNMIMCVIPTDRFYNLKKIVSTIDKKVEFISQDCYTVEGGKTNHIIPI